MKVIIAADHNGFELKGKLIDKLKEFGYEVVDAGDEHFDPDDDFPVFAARAVNQLLAHGTKDARAILICGSGQGMCMAANRFRGIRAAVAWDAEEARLARNDDDSNVLCLSSRALSAEHALDISLTWLKTNFANAPRYIRRIKELDNLPDTI